MKNLSKLLLLAGLALILGGCVRKVIVSEALQIAKGTKLYLAYNVWYTDPEDISALNYQTGKILPFGTEVEVIKANARSVTFVTRNDNKQFKIDFDRGWMLVPIEKYLPKIFVTKDRAELSKGINAEFMDKISRGVVCPGMNKREVILAYGYPVPYMTPSLDSDTWVYGTDRLDTVRIVYKGNKVNTILKID